MFHCSTIRHAHDCRIIGVPACSTSCHCAMNQVPSMRTGACRSDLERRREDAISITSQSAQCNTALTTTGRKTQALGQQRVELDCLEIFSLEDFLFNCVFWIFSSENCWKELLEDSVFRIVFFQFENCFQFILDFSLQRLVGRLCFPNSCVLI